MGMITVTARVASTHPVEKYNGVRLSEGALRQMGRALSEGDVPLTFDHSSLMQLRGSNVAAEVESLEDGEFPQCNL
jgi:hypothetical protein